MSSKLQSNGCYYYTQQWRPLVKRYEVRTGVVCLQVKLCDRGAIQIYVYLYLYTSSRFRTCGNALVILSTSLWTMWVFLSTDVFEIKYDNHDGWTQT